MFPIALFSVYDRTGVLETLPNFLKTNKSLIKYASMGVAGQDDLFYALFVIQLSLDMNV